MTLSRRSGIPHAARFEIHDCNACPNAHIVLYDGADRPFAAMTVGPDQVETVKKGLLEAISMAARKNVDRQNLGTNEEGN